jgi:intraflagellar transport protein 81
VICNLSNEIKAIQEEFKNTHKHLEGIKQSGNSALGLKREIQQMEEEKQQLLSKIIKIKTKVQQMPRSEQWLKSAQKLRTQQELEQNLLDKSSEQKQLIEKADIKLESLKQQYKQVFQASKSNSPDSVFNKLSEETKMNSIFVKESYPKMLVLLEQKLKTLEEITQKDQFGDEELLKLEQGLQEFNVKNAKLAEEKLKYRYFDLN